MEHGALLLRKRTGGALPFLFLCAGRFGFERAEVRVVRWDTAVFHKSRPAADRHGFFRDQTPDLPAGVPWPGVHGWIGKRHLQYQPISARARVALLQNRLLADRITER